MDGVRYMWRGDFTSSEANLLHAEAFNHRAYQDYEWDWVQLCNEHSLGWVTARLNGQLVGFVNVLWDGSVHAWIQDEMVSLETRHQGVGLRLIELARDAAREAGCEWLHVDFDDDLRPFYIDAAGFTPTNGGLIDLTDPD